MNLPKALEPIPIPVERWKPRSTGRFTASRDLRGLLAIEHPWLPSLRGRWGQWESNAPLPPGWQPGGRLYVSFYQSDNYSGNWRESGWMGTQAFIGHRFKQLWVNGRLAWEQDVADEEMAGSLSHVFSGQPGQPGYLEAYRVVEITRFVHRELHLVFRVTDRRASTEKLRGDAYKRFFWSAYDPRKAAKNFQTSVYFGDVHLSFENRIVKPVGPVSDVLEGRRVQVAQCLPVTSIPLALVTPGRLPSCGYPVRSGMPLPRGVVAPGTSFGLRGPGGGPVAIATTELSHWPDGSLQWLLCEFVATRSGSYRLVVGARPHRPGKPVLRRTRNGVTLLTNGLVSLTMDARTRQGVFQGLSRSGGLGLGPADLSVKLDRVGWRDHFTARRRCFFIERSNPLCTVVRVEGDLLGPRKWRFGVWRARLHLWAGLPYLGVEWRLVNESDQAMAMLLDWSARIRLPDLWGAEVDFGPFVPGFDSEDIGVKAMGHHGRIARPRRIPLHKDSELSCRQERADQARIYRNTTWVAKAAAAPGFLRFGHPRGGLVASLRWFAEEFPKGIVVRPEMLSLATLPESTDALGWPHDRPHVRIGRGEAKRQTFALWLSDDNPSGRDAEVFNACVQDPPRLFNQSWFIRSGALECGPPRRSRGLARWARSVTPIIERTGIGAPRLGHREYWDTAWSNDYRGRAHLGLLQYVETADPRWFRYFDAACTHTRDVDIIHFCPEHPEWVGAPHAYGEDHTSCGPMGNIGINVDSLLDHFLLTGDPDSLEAARGVARHLMGCSAWARSARSVGWPLAQIVRWYEFSGDRRFLRRAREFVEAARAYTEPRRGIFDELHGCWNYRGAVPFMTGYLAFGLIRYHRLTGDPSGLDLLRRLAAGLFAECRVAPGRFRYSPFPENNAAPSRYRSWNALLGGCAGYLYQVTRENLYARWADECYQGIVERSKDPQVTMDMLQTAGWMLGCRE